MEKIDSSIDSESNENYSRLQRYYGQYKNQIQEKMSLIDGMDIPSAQERVIQLFQESKKEFGNKTLNFILRQSLYLCSHQMILDPKIDGLFKNFLEIMGIGNLSAESYLMDMRY